jgi:hypothetical protein
MCQPEPYFVSFVYFVPLPYQKEARMSGYLDLAKGVVEKAPLKNSREELVDRRQHKLEEAGRRGLVVRWSEYPNWIALQIEVRAEDCFPSLVDEANRRGKRA